MAISLVKTALRTATKGTTLSKTQEKIRKAAKAKGVSVKTFRMQNPNNPNVKKLYSMKPNIKSADSMRSSSRKAEAAFKRKNALEKKHDRIAQKYAGNRKIPQERLDDYADYQMNAQNPIEGMYKVRDKNGKFTGEFRDVSTGKINRVDGSKKGGLMSSIRKQNGGRIATPTPSPRRKRKAPGHANEQYMPKLPYKISPDGYYYLEEKGADVSVPKAKPKAQRRKKGGRIY